MKNSYGLDGFGKIVMACLAALVAIPASGGLVEQAIKVKTLVLTAGAAAIGAVGAAIGL